MKLRPSEHWVCFACRKQFRRPSRGYGERGSFAKEPHLVTEHSCPECKAPMVNMGKYFRPPRRANKKAWEQMRLLAEHGIHFCSEGTVAYQRMATGPKPSLRQTKQSIAACPKGGGYTPFKHVRQYAHIGDDILRALSAYGSDVRDKKFP